MRRNIQFPWFQEPATHLVVPEDEQDFRRAFDLSWEAISMAGQIVDFLSRKVGDRPGFAAFQIKMGIALSALRQAAQRLAHLGQHYYEVEELREMDQAVWGEFVEELQNPKRPGGDPGVDEDGNINLRVMVVEAIGQLEDANRYVPAFGGMFKSDDPVTQIRLNITAAIAVLEDINWE